MNEEEIKLLNKIEELPRELNIEIRGLILAEICLRKENQQLKEEFDRMFAIYHNRKLIKKFNDEYDEEDKMKNPNRDYACVCPDAEEVYKRYYELKEQLKQKEDIINKAKEYNNQIIKDTKEFYRPTSDLIYSGDCLIDLAEQNIKILDNKGE